MGESIPPSLRPPVQVALAKAVTAIPDVPEGQLIFEPKFDGFRVVVIRDGDKTSLFSRQGKDLTRYVPELAAAAAAMIPPAAIVDGEAVVWSGDRLDFEALQRRLSAGKQSLPAMVRELPASFVGFDLLCVEGHDTRHLPLRDRRALLKELASAWSAPLSLSPATSDAATARQWAQDLAEAGIEGLVAKRLDKPYEAGKRTWWKYKERSAADVVCAAVIGPIDRPEEIVAGLPHRGQAAHRGQIRPADRHRQQGPGPLAETGHSRAPMAGNRQRNHAGPLQPRRLPGGADPC